VRCSISVASSRLYWVEIIATQGDAAPLVFVRSNENHRVLTTGEVTRAPRAAHGAKLCIGQSPTTMTYICKFCSVFHLAEAPCDRPIFRTPNFIVAPTIGALVPGWMLVVSTRHYISAGALPHDALAELRDTIEAVVTAMRSTGRTPAVFEHGPVCENTVVGCGIDHCHIHVAPLEFDLYSEAAQLSKAAGIRWEPAPAINATKAYHEGGRPYLYIEQNGLRQIGTSSNIPSQFFRRVIASQQGRPEEFDWKRHPVATAPHLAEANRLSLVLPGAHFVG
jgi:ATP adenylyltransferase